MTKRISHRVAVLSDIHGNVAALRAVLTDLDALGVDGIFVAGDVVGFGPNPVEAVDLLASRGARMVRGNHEKDYVSVYATPQMPASWWAAPRARSGLWTMERLGPERRAFLAALPDRLLIDEATLVVHGSPRHHRDMILASTSDEELETMLDGETASLTFVGHTHRSLVRYTRNGRVVNVGSVGFPLDGDPRATYALATHIEGDAPGSWGVEIRRVPYDFEETIASFRNGLGEADPCFAEVLSRQLRTGRSYLSPWLRVSESLPIEELPAALDRFLAVHP